jgi:uncharacterized repeat protein (TIGR01451 family)
LVKRITGIKPAGSSTIVRTTNPNETTSPTLLNTVVHNPLDTANNDINPNWPSNYVVGAYNAGKIKTGDEIEYTIYYLNTSGADTKSLRICDPIRGKQDYVSNSMSIQPGGSTTPLTLTDTLDSPGTDRAQSYTTATAPTNCNATSSTATGISDGSIAGVSVTIDGTGASGQPDLTAIPSGAVGGNPNTSYGWFRFRTKVR